MLQSTLTKSKEHLCRVSHLEFGLLGRVWEVGIRLRLKQALGLGCRAGLGCDLGLGV